MVTNEGDKLKRVIVCSPGQEYVSFLNKEAHNIAELADLEKAKIQHDILKTVLGNSGCHVIDVPELFGHPNSVFTRDAALCTPQGYLKLQMGLDTRKGEETWLEEVLQKESEPIVGTLEPPAIMEGGDVILAGHVAFVGKSHRSNAPGVYQLSAWLGWLGYKIRTVEVPEQYLHIGGAMSMIGPHTVLCCEGVFPDGFFDGYETIVVPSGNFISANVICIHEGEIIAERSNREAITLLRQRGLEVHALDLSEFVKGTGGPSCLVMPVERVGD